MNISSINSSANSKFLRWNKLNTPAAICAMCSVHAMITITSKCIQSGERVREGKNKKYQTINLIIKPFHLINSHWYFAKKIIFTNTVVARWPLYNANVDTCNYNYVHIYIHSSITYNFKNTWHLEASCTLQVYILTCYNSYTITFHGKDCFDRILPQLPQNFH